MTPQKQGSALPPCAPLHLEAKQAVGTSTWAGGEGSLLPEHLQRISAALG